MSKSSGNARKDELLGEPHGTAANRLRKSLLFKYVQLAGHDVCFRCGRKIETVRELSIEHTIEWQRADKPAEAFFHLDKIAFSHLSCNSGACEQQPKERGHGNGGYDRGCRCATCRSWKATKNAHRNGVSRRLAGQ